MMLGENDGLKGCAARPGKPAPALDPLALTRRLAVMPFRGGRVPRKRSVMSTGRAVTFLSGRNCDFSNGDRQKVYPQYRDDIMIDQGRNPNAARSYSLGVAHSGSA